MNKSNLKVALLPINISNGNPVESLRIAVEMIESISERVDLIVLPETFTSAFVNDIEVLRSCARYSSTALSILRKISSDFRIAIFGSIVAEDDNTHLYNRGFYILPDREPQFYDKRHLFGQGGEARLLTQGKSKAPIVKFEGWSISMAICYDVRFPVWTRNIANDYDILIVPANWPEVRNYAWQHLLIARAIENQCYVLGCNRTGADIYGHYLSDSSRVYDYMGKCISHQLPDTDIIYAELDSEKFCEAREKFMPWRDADHFTIDL